MKVRSERRTFNERRLRQFRSGKVNIKRQKFAVNKEHNDTARDS